MNKPMENQEIAIGGNGYAAWIESLSVRYRQSQIKAAVAVNVEMLKFYFGLGRDITIMEKDQPWGSGFLNRVSFDLKSKMPDAGCFSPTNLKYMRWFWQLYAPFVLSPQAVDKSESAISPQLVDSITPQFGDELDSLVFHVPWGHQRYIIDKFRNDPDKAMFYVRETVKNGWSRAVLLNFLDTKLHERQGKAVSNFAVALPEADSDLAQEVTKDPYCFDFIALTPKYREKELKDAMMEEDNTMVKWALESSQQPIGISEYRISEILPKEIASDLPSIADIESAVGGAE